MATEAEPPPRSSSSEEGGGGDDEVDKGKLVVVVTIEEDGGQQPPPWRREGPEVVHGGGELMRPVVFTKDQFAELQRQLAVLSYICHRIPVPSSLLMPARAYVHSSDSGLCRPLQASAGSSPRSSGRCSVMEPEPGRCRRTDGKRWRCKNGVIPNTKYCQRHIHRGCNRSRKLVEGSVSNPTASPSMASQPPQQASSYKTPLRPLPPSNSTKNLENSCDVSCNTTSSRSLAGDVAPEAPAISSNSVHAKYTCTVSAAASKDVRPNSGDPTGHDKASTMVDLGSKPTHKLVTAALGGPTSKTIMGNVEFTHTAKPADAANSNDIGKEHTFVTGSSKVTPNSMSATPSNVSGQMIITKDMDFTSSSCAASTIAISMVAKGESGDRRSHGNGNSQSIGQDSSTERRTHIRDIDKLKVNTSQRFNFSPKSVLQGESDHPHPNPSIQGCSPMCIYKSDLEGQPWRCRRTDGRKWRCRMDVIPNEKYCAMHIHRGAKKQAQNSQPTDLPSGKRSKATHPHLNPSLPGNEKCTSLDTDLSISALEMSRLIGDDEPSSTGDSSDATISDDKTSYEIN